MAMKFGLLVGSLGEASANAAALSVAEAHVHQQRHRTHWLTGLGSVPPFVPADSDNAPSPVASFRKQIESVDALLLAAPEYAGGVSGAVKNALDWLVGSASLYHIPVGVLSVGTTGGEHAIEQLVRTLSWQGGLVVATLGVSAPRAKSDSDGRIIDPITIAAIRACVDRATEAHHVDPAKRLALVRAVVEPFGIDADRLGELT